MVKVTFETSKGKTKTVGSTQMFLIKYNSQIIRFFFGTVKNG